MKEDSLEPLLSLSNSQKFEINWIFPENTSISSESGTQDRELLSATPFKSEYIPNRDTAYKPGITLSSYMENIFCMTSLIQILACTIYIYKTILLNFGGGW